MLETWHQWTCDGCGETEYTAMPDETRAQARAYLRARGVAQPVRQPRLLRSMRQAWRCETQRARYERVIVFDLVENNENKSDEDIAT